MRYSLPDGVTPSGNRLAVMKAFRDLAKKYPSWMNLWGEAILSALRQEEGAVAWVGPPGIGKSKVLNFWAREINGILGYQGAAAFVFVGATKAPHDIAGIPWIDKDDPDETRVKMALMGAIRDASEAARAGLVVVLLLDEMTRLQPSVEAACLSLIADRVAGDTRLPPGISIMAAMNPMEHTLAAVGLSVAGGRRFVWREIDVASVPFIESFLEGFPHMWGDADTIAGDWRMFDAPYYKSWLVIIAEYLGDFPSRICMEVTKGSGAGNVGAAAVSAPNPRSWAMAARDLAGTKPDKKQELATIEMRLSSIIGPSQATNFSSWFANRRTFSPALVMQTDKGDLFQVAKSSDQEEVLGTVTDLITKQALNRFYDDPYDVLERVFICATALSKDNLEALRTRTKGFAITCMRWGINPASDPIAPLLKQLKRGKL